MHNFTPTHNISCFSNCTYTQVAVMVIFSKGPVQETEAGTDKLSQTPKQIDYNLWILLAVPIYYFHLEDYSLKTPNLGTKPLLCIIWVEVHTFIYIIGLW